MSAYELTGNVIERIKDNQYDVLILNFANPDMVGHTGDIKAVTKAVEVTDECVGKILECIDSINGCALVTADHGNAENMIDAEGGPQTAHTTNLVHVFYYGKDHANWKLKSGKLADVAPTMLKLLGIAQPEEMTGECLVEAVS
jgi:2,3-bisphosphoglycerate-independent phosphoglycerate mutase